MKGLDKVGKFAKGVLSGTKAEIVVNSLDDIAKHSLKSIDEIVNKVKITSLLELKRIGISSVDDLMTLGVTTAKDLPKLGIHTMKDLAKLGIKNVDDFIEAGLSSLDDANMVFKGVSGAGVNGLGNSIKSNTGKVIDTTPSKTHTTVTKNPGLKGEPFKCRYNGEKWGIKYKALV